MAYALAFGNEDMVRLLFSRGANLSKSAGSRSPVVILAAGVFDTSLRMLPLLKHLGWNPDSPVDALGNSLLHTATGQLRPELMKQLMSSHSSALILNCEGDLPLHLLLRIDTDCWDWHLLSLAKILLQRDVKEQLNRKDCEGKTALHHIIRSVTRITGRLGQPDTDLVRYCIDHGADVTIRDDHGNIPLNFTLTSSWSRDVVGVEISLANAARLLRNHTQAQLSSRNFERQTPLQVALTAERQYEALVILYLNAGADLFAEDDTGRTPLERIIEDHPYWRKANRLVRKMMRAAGLQSPGGLENSSDDSGTVGEALTDKEKKALIEGVLSILKEYRKRGLDKSGQLDALFEQAAPYMDEVHFDGENDAEPSITGRQGLESHSVEVAELADTSSNVPPTQQIAVSAIRNR